MPEKQLCELTVITVGYHRRFIIFVFFHCFFEFSKKLFFWWKNKVTKKLARVITILVIHKSITAAETIVTVDFCSCMLAPPLILTSFAR